MTSSQQSTIIARPASEWGSDEYEDPTSPQRTSLKSRKSSMSTFGPIAGSRPGSTISPNPTYDMYQDPAANQNTAPVTSTANNTIYDATYRDPAANPRATLATSTVNNAVYSDTYQDPAARQSHTLPSSMAAMPEHVYSDTYRDPTQAAPTLPPTGSNAEPQEIYEIPGAGEDDSDLTRHYSVLEQGDLGVTSH